MGINNISESSNLGQAPGVSLNYNYNPTEGQWTPNTGNPISVEGGVTVDLSWPGDSVGVAGLATASVPVSGLGINTFPDSYKGTTTAVSNVVAAPGVGKHVYLTSVTAGAAGATLTDTVITIVLGNDEVFNLSTPIKFGDNKALSCSVGATVHAVYFTN
jgi:hypothetical protein|tara:strand:+ start:480 stop:956 length:477 start_codon:yes stop_codon:yes gene_type:complete